MTKRETTIAKESEVLKIFHRLLRSGKDFTARSMYKEAGKPCFLTSKRVGDIVRSHYNSVINTDMMMFILNSMDLKYSSRVKSFSLAFGFCERESRLIMKYIHRRLSINENLTIDND